MSIYGPDFRCSKGSGAGLDIKDSPTALKAGNLDMKGNRVKNLPLIPLDHSDACSAAFVIREDMNVKAMAVLRDGSQAMTDHLNLGMHNIKNVLDPTNAQDVATKNYVDSRKPLITVWAEERRQLNSDKYEWSFGDGCTGWAHKNSGYTMLARGRVLRMGLAVSVDNKTTNPIAIVNLVVNGETKTNYSVTKPAGLASGTVSFTQPFELTQGDCINFKSATTVQNALTSIVNLLIELDL